MRAVLDHLPRQRLATLPTPLERGPELPGGARLWVKRDDLTGLGGGGNKARKLEFLCGEAIAASARSLVTVGAPQSNHCRMTAAAGSVLGLEVHLVLAGDRPARPEGNLLLSAMFGAQLHFTGAHHSHWGELEIAREQLAGELSQQGAAPFSVPIGGSTTTGALGYVVAYGEIVRQCERARIRPKAIVHTSSSGGTHAGLLAARALHAASGAPPNEIPDVVAIGVARGVIRGDPDVAALARSVLDRLERGDTPVARSDVQIESRWMGADYGVPTEGGDAAIAWAARRGGWLLDRTYTGKGLSGVLDLAAGGRWGPGDDVVFVHTGGAPALFGPDGVPTAGS